MTGAGTGAADLRVENLWLSTARTEVPLGFVREGDAVFLVARERAAQWPVEALRSGRVHLRFRDGAGDGRPTLVTEPSERERVLGLFLLRYGAERFARWYEHPARVLRVDLGPPGAPTGEAPRYSAWLEAEFDNVAEEYDRHITGNRMNMLLRSRSLAQLRPLFQGRRRLLEVGCGSGMETLPLLREGHEITALDISSRMLDVVRRKASAEGLSERLTTRQLPARSLGELSIGGSGRFDGAYSTYGALNCEEDLGPIPPALADLLVPGAPFLAGIYNRWCLAELAAYGITMRPSRALGRRMNPIPVGASRFCVDVYAYSASEFVGRLRPWFELERIEGVPVILPPSDLTSYAEKFSRRFDWLARWDAWLGRRWPFWGLGDHFLATFRRRTGTG